MPPAAWESGAGTEVRRWTPAAKGGAPGARCSPAVESPRRPVPAPWRSMAAALGAPCAHDSQVSASAPISQ